MHVLSSLLGYSIHAHQEVRQRVVTNCTTLCTPPPPPPQPNCIGRAVAEGLASDHDQTSFCRIDASFAYIR